MSETVRVTLGAARASLDRRLFGTFVEHMGRSVYEGIYEPGHPSADADGFRGDVLELVRDLGATVVRYPGGNFVSGYRWEDGVGPLDARPVRLDAAWRGIETNRVGLHEFADWALRAGLELVEAVNLGTRGIQEAADLLEYANVAGGTTLSERRRANGRDEPFGIRMWCLGNEVDGPWQIGHKTADEYGRLAAEAARMMRFIDADLELVVAGSSNLEMPTFGAWERTVLGHTAELVDHISIHAYYEERDGDTDSFLASAVHLDRYIAAVAAVIDEVRAEHPAARPIGISVDEWNVWNQTRWNTVDKEPVLAGPWTEHARLIEDEYTVTDAVVVGSLLISLLRNADRVSMANLAQLVNVIAPIRTEAGGPAWRQTIFFPFQLTAAAAHGEVIGVEIDSPVLETAVYGAVPAIDAAATRDGSRVAVFLVNRDRTTAHTVTIAAADAASVLARTVTIPVGGDERTANTAVSQPVHPEPLDVRVEPTHITLTLAALSWTVVEFETTGATRA